MINHVTTQLGNDGLMVMVEPELQPGLERRVFRRTADGGLEWTHLAAWEAQGCRARFYSYFSKELPESMTCGEES